MKEQEELDALMEMNTFHYYSKQFEKKQKVWTKNEIKKIDTDF